MADWIRRSFTSADLTQIPVGPPARYHVGVMLRNTDVVDRAEPTPDGAVALRLLDRLTHALTAAVHRVEDLASADMAASLNALRSGRP
jgi:hypothetical protein